jgi:beta-propeller repeat-containing protein
VEQWRTTEGLQNPLTFLGNPWPTQGMHPLALDSNSNVYVTGYALGKDYLESVTIKYDSTGVMKWRTTAGGLSDDYTPSALALDTGGNVYITGTYFVSGHWDYLTIKYNGAGVEQWRMFGNGAANSRDRAAGIAVDAGGNVYVTGQSFNGTYYDYLTISYTTGGAERWRAVTRGPLGDYVPSAIGVDSQGNAYVTGTGTGTCGPGCQTSPTDCFTVSYSPSGAERWRAICNAPPNAYFSPSSIAIDGASNVYIAGRATDASSAKFTRKYDTNGVELWSAFEGPAAGGYTDVFALAVDAYGNVYVTGPTTDSATDTWTFKRSSTIRMASGNGWRLP